jgi:lysine 6-dehydrogenase
MKVVVLGTGIQGQTVAYDLVQAKGVASILLTDTDAAKLASAATWLNSPKVQTKIVDVSHAPDLKAAIRGSTVVINCAPYDFCLPVTLAAIAEKVSLVDLGGDTEVVRKQLALDSEAKSAGIVVVPDCGVSPGITNVMVGHAMDKLDSANEVWIRDGGLPQNPKPPLFYSKLFSIDVLINEYNGKTNAVRDFKIVDVDSLSDVEELDLPSPVGRCEATYGMGMLSSLPWTYQGRIRNMDNKFIRYPGHLSFFSTLKTMGFFDSKPLVSNVSARDITKQILDTYLDDPSVQDLYVIKIKVNGLKSNQPVNLEYSMLDFCDEKTGLSSMSRGTGFSASIVAQMIASGMIGETGVIPPERLPHKDHFFEELKARGFQVEIP